ncbi:MAG: hypothetical protein U9M92_02070 [Patescibacteria group bacterium]|nr:hypothetical protein [Patescibacteria group bacterium]
MRKFQTRNWGRRIIYSKWAVAVLIVLVLLLLRSVILTWQRERLAGDGLTEVREQVAALEVRKEQLAADLALLETERGVEERIRRQFAVAKEGEKVMTVVLPDRPADSAAPSAILPWWQPLLDLFD